MRPVKTVFVTVPVLMATAFSGCSGTPDTPDGHPRSARAASTAVADRVTPSPTAVATTPPPEPVPADLGARLRDPRRLRQVLARRHLRFQWIEYTSATDAAAYLTGCYSCRSVLLTTHDRWRNAAAIILPAATAEIWFAAMPGGSVAAVTNDGLTNEQSVPPLVLHADGGVTVLRASGAPRTPTAASVLTTLPYPAFPGRFGPPVWVLDDTVVSPALAQPLRAVADGPEGPFVGADGTAHLGLWRNPRGPARARWLFASSTDNGVHWTRATTRPLIDIGGEADLAFGPGRRVAAVLIDGFGPVRRGLHSLWVSRNGRAWRRIPTSGTLATLGGIAYTPTGALLLAESTQQRLWRLGPTGRGLRPLTRGPRRGELLYRSGSVILLGDEPGTRSMWVSTNGRDWRHLTIRTLRAALS